MKKSVLNFLLFCTLISTVVYSCVKKKNYSIAPQIEYKNFTPLAGDSANIQIKFTDGDGDIGVLEGDSTLNIWINYYYKDTITQQYVGYYIRSINDTLRTGYTVKRPSDAYLGRAISGELSIVLQGYRHSTTIKNIRYVIYMYDNARHKSNIITTPELLVP